MCLPKARYRVSLDITDAKSHRIQYILYDASIHTDRSIQSFDMHSGGNTVDACISIPVRVSASETSRLGLRTRAEHLHHGMLYHQLQHMAVLVLCMDLLGN